MWENSWSLCNLSSAASNTHAVRPSPTSGVSVLAREVPVSDWPSWCCTCFTRWPGGLFFVGLVSARVCLWSSEAKPKTSRYLFYVFQTEPPTQSQHTTGRSIHICYSDLRHHHFIVWHTICIKLQFSVLKGLVWFKTVADVQKETFHTHEGDLGGQELPWIFSCRNDLLIFVVVVNWKKKFKQTEKYFFMFWTKNVGLIIMK